MKLFKILACSLLLNSACIYTSPIVTTPSPSVRPIGVNFTQTLTTGTVTFEREGITPLVEAITANRAGFPSFPSAISVVNVHIRAEGYLPYDCVTNIPDGSYDFFMGPTTLTGGYGQGWFVGANGSVCPRSLTPLAPPHVDPSNIPLSTLANIKGAMWPTGLGLPFGPRPGSPDNIIATDFFNNYSPADQTRILQWEKDNGYTHVVVGPIVDSDGYHGKYTPNDWRDKFDEFLDILQTFWDNGQAPIVFIHPDGWTLAQTQALTPLFQSERAQRLMRIVVPTGWEPTRYDWSSCTWAAYAQWARTTWPNALVLIHTVTDTDAPVGTDALCDDNGHPNSDGWARVTPYIHGWLVQNSAFADPTGIAPNGKTNFQNFQDQFNPQVSGSLTQRFRNGYAGWPTNSAWGNQPIKVYAGEFAAYWVFWQNRLYSDAVAWGNAAVTAGADGALDGISIAVPQP